VKKVLSIVERDTKMVIKSPVSGAQYEECKVEESPVSEESFDPIWY
jgi:hypothetical protein